jgi:hypothetical protein
MSATIIHMPGTGWCVRPGIRCAHFLYWQRGRLRSLCGGLDRVEQYVPQRLRPLQADKPHCIACEQRLSTKMVAQWH